MTSATHTYVSLQDAAAFYGVHPRTIRRRVAEGSLAAVRVGPRIIRVSLDDVQMLACRIPTAGPSAAL